MLFTKKSVADKRADFRTALNSGKLQRFVGAYSPLVAMMIEKVGFEGVYVSGGVMANDLGLPDIGLTELEEVARRSYQISRVASLPTLIDIDTGFGEPMNLVRTIQKVEELGIAGVHLEDQVNPKRCGHLDNKSVVSTEEMVKKIRAAQNAKQDKNFLLMARTDARAIEGLEKTIDRIKAYVDAGADAIFPEAMKDESDFEAVRKATDVPLLANMTEFGKSKLLSTNELTDLGYNIVLYPVTTQRLAMKNVEDGLKKIMTDGHQNNAVDMMQTRQDLYDLIEYDRYNEFDQSIYNFKLK